MSPRLRLASAKLRYAEIACVALIIRGFFDQPVIGVIGAIAWPLASALRDVVESRSTS